MDRRGWGIRVGGNSSVGDERCDTTLVCMGGDNK